MSKYPKNSNPFEDDHYNFGNKASTNQENGFTESDLRRQKWEEAYASEDRQLESTRRAMASIYDSESIGIAAAEELVRQGEILDSVETKTGNINQNLKSSQGHLNSIKSVFGGIKTWWQGGNTTTPREPVSSPRKLQNTIDKEKQAVAASPKLKSGDVSGFYDDSDENLDSRFLAGSSGKHPGQQKMFQPVTNSAREKDIDENLVLMSAGMARLKGLATGLGDEIDTQNEQLDRINRKVDVANHRLEGQNKQMRGILK
ncbi:synaptosomal-associated protein 29 isoform X1 [Patella vulgata]|uniref:synaptosomal-associated protein 29 isoform X1 n=1 Tax=Patella vulgata TaxID=6465 RepID=UPI00217FC836|nr:synaptosomal-associated protein 29 isoform X1 [Patella vulgata]